MIRLTPPTVPGVVSSGWGRPRSYRDGWHAGLDFFAPKGTPVLAAADGVVSYVKNHANSYAGKWIAINHDGTVTRYLHSDTNLVTKGQRVTRGQKIGTVGTTGTSSSAPHVHFDVKVPQNFLERFIAEYGTPSTGFAPDAGWGVGVPAESFMSGAKYQPGVLEAAVAKGVTPYKGRGWLIAGGIAIVAGFYAARYL